MSRSEIEGRLASIEAEIAALKAMSSVSPPGHPVDALERLHGTFENDKAFKEAMRLGRQWRTSDQPKPRAAKARRR